MTYILLTFSEWTPCTRHWRCVISSFFSHHTVYHNTCKVLAEQKLWKEHRLTSVVLLLSVTLLLPFNIFPVISFYSLQVSYATQWKCPPFKHLSAACCYISIVYHLNSPVPFLLALKKLAFGSAREQTEKSCFGSLINSCSVSLKSPSCFHLPPNDQLWGNMTSFLWCLASWSPFFKLDCSQPNKTVCPWYSLELAGIYVVSSICKFYF